MALTIINSKDELTSLIHSQKPFVLMVSTTWCGPCRKFTPVFEEISEQIKEITFVKINIDEVADANDVLGVGSVPTMILWKEGKEIHREIGGMQRSDLISVINSKLG